MLRNTLKLSLILVGVHLFLGAVLLVTEAAHGINDQDPSFALLLLVLYLNRPSVWILEWLGVPVVTTSIALAGILQWVFVAFIISGAYYGFKTRAQQNVHRERGIPEHADSSGG